MVGDFDHLLPTSKADMWSFMGRKSVAYLGYLCCQAEEWFARGWYPILFRGEVENGLTLLENFGLLLVLLIFEFWRCMGLLSPLFFLHHLFIFF
jgi:hypothetical protein